MNNSTPNGSPNSTSKGGIGTVGTVAIGLVLGLVVLVLIGVAFLCLRKRKKKVSGLNGGYVMPATLGSSPRSGSTITLYHYHIILFPFFIFFLFEWVPSKINILLDYQHSKHVI